MILIIVNTLLLVMMIIRIVRRRALRLRLHIILIMIIIILLLNMNIMIVIHNSSFAVENNDQYSFIINEKSNYKMKKRAFYSNHPIKVGVHCTLYNTDYFAMNPFFQTIVNGFKYLIVLSSRI